MRLLAGAVATGVVLLGSSLSQVARAEQPAVPMATRVRSLAENVLGQGLIRALTITDRGATVLMRWEAATYKPTQKVEEAREQLFGESELVTGSILGGLLSIGRIRFSLLRKDGQVLAAGENTRGPGVVLRFSPILGGGTYTTTASKQNTGKKSGGASAAKD